MNNRVKKRYITSSEIKELINNSNIDKLKNIFVNLNFNDNEFIKILLSFYILSFDLLIQLLPRI